MHHHTRFRTKDRNVQRKRKKNRKKSKEIGIQKDSNVGKGGKGERTGERTRVTKSNLHKWIRAGPFVTT
jgi:hypothetical protein